MHFPQWVDLKGQDSVPDTVHQVVCMIDPREDMSWARLRSKQGESVKVYLDFKFFMCVFLYLD